MTPQSNYEQARDEAAEFAVSCYENSTCNHCDLSSTKEIEFNFKAGADFGRSYTAVEYANTMILNADLLADCKATRETLELISSPSEWNCEIGESNQRAAAVKTLSQLKGKYNE